MLAVSCSSGPVAVADFEGADYGAWTAEGTAFGNRPATGGINGQQPVSGFEGRGLANSYHGGDETLGTLTSPAFVIERNYINFLIGGGMHQGLYMELLIDGQACHTARPEVQSETLHRQSWDVQAYKGREAVIRIVDNQKGGWGHILVDAIEMHDEEAAAPLMGHSLSFDIEKKYLLIPIEDKGRESVLRLSVDGAQADHNLYLRVAQRKTDYWVPMLVEQYKGRRLTLSFDQARKSDIGYAQIKQADEFEFAYQETYRPAYHFSPPHGWTNDPNGMVWLDGEYHLFYQHNPYGSMWANMHWGHAVSTDLVHWQHLPVALAPDALGSIFSGSAVVDTDNTAGFGHNALVAIYTSAGERQTQSIAYSLDKGRTFTKYAGNPVLTDAEIADFRDPKVFWHAESKRWIMSLATSQTITFYGSENLKEWSRLSEFGQGIGAHGGVWECPDLFALTTPDGRTKWVLLVSINPGGPNGGSATQYFIGSFNGTTFVPDALPYPLWIDYGRDNYAGVTWDNAPQGNRIFMGWMSNWDYTNDAPSLNFRNGMTLPRTLSIGHNGRHPVLVSTPLPATEQLRTETVTFATQRIETNEAAIERLLENNTGAFELEMNIVPGGTSIFGFGFTNTKGDYLNFTFDHELGKLMLDRREAGITNFNETFASVQEAPLVRKSEYAVRVFFDKASVELFLNNGELVMTSTVFPREVFNRMTFFSPRGSWMVKDIKVSRLE